MFSFETQQTCELQSNRLQRRVLLIFVLQPGNQCTQWAVSCLNLKRNLLFFFFENL